MSPFLVSGLGLLPSSPPPGPLSARSGSRSAEPNGTLKEEEEEEVPSIALSPSKNDGSACHGYDSRDWKSRGEDGARGMCVCGGRSGVEFGVEEVVVVVGVWGTVRRWFGEGVVVVIIYAEGRSGVLGGLVSFEEGWAL